MSAMTPEPKDSPLMLAWGAYLITPEYENARRWAVNAEDTEGCLWAAFSQGWRDAATPDAYAELHRVSAEREALLQHLKEARDIISTLHGTEAGDLTAYSPVLKRINDAIAKAESEAEPSA